MKYRNRRPRDGIYRVVKICSCETDTCNQCNINDYIEEADIPLFYGTLGVEDYLNWRIDVDKFFDIMEVPENNQVKMVTVYWLTSVASIWWDKIIIQRGKQMKIPVKHGRIWNNWCRIDYYRRIMSIRYISSINKRMIQFNILNPIMLIICWRMFSTKIWFFVECGK